MRRLLIALVLILTGSGCALPVRYIDAPLPIPPRPTLPTVSPAELAPLTPDAYRKVAERERLRRQYAELLEAIMYSHNGESPP